MATRPISQTGFHHIPRNPKQRNFGEGGVKAKRTKLAAFNEQQETRQLHPTNGFVGLSVKRARAQAIMAGIHNGTFPFNTAKMAHFLREGY